MMALCWHGKHALRYERVPDPMIEHPRDAIVKVALTAIGGADLHLYDAALPGLADGTIPGREFVGEVVEVGDANRRLKPGERVVVPSAVACGECGQCRLGSYSSCEVSNPRPALAGKMAGQALGAVLGGSRVAGGYPGGHAEYVRVPYADIGPVPIPDGIDDEDVLLLGDTLPSGWQAVAQCAIRLDDVVAIWGAGPVGLYAAIGAFALGAAAVIAIDCVPERLELARKIGATPLDFTRLSVADTLAEHTRGRGPDKCIDAVGLQAHAIGAVDAAFEPAAAARAPGSDSPHVLREMIYACRPGGMLSIAGLYGGRVDRLPFGALVNKGLTVRAGQTQVGRWIGDLLRRIVDREIDSTFAITHRGRLEDGPSLYELARKSADGCVKAVMRVGS